jgi:hypothetical protein
MYAYVNYLLKPLSRNQTISSINNIAFLSIIGNKLDPLNNNIFHKNDKKELAELLKYSSPREFYVITHYIESATVVLSFQNCFTRNWSKKGVICFSS